MLVLFFVAGRGSSDQRKSEEEASETTAATNYIFMRRQATKKQEPATRHGSTEELLTSETETPPTKPKPSTFTAKKPTSASTQTLTTEKELSSVAELSAATTITKVVSATKPPASTVKKTPEVIKPSATTTRKVSSVSKHPVTSTQKTERVTQQPGKINKTLSPKELHPELGPRPLVCVYGNGSLASSPFPEDGLCDAALFDSLYKYPGYALSTVHDQKLAHLRRFLRRAEEYELTRFGMGVTAGAAEIAKAEFSSNTAEKHYLPYLWSNNVYDLGVLDFVPDENTNEEQAQRIFDFLKECKRLQGLILEKKGLKAYIVLGITLFKNYDNIYEAFTVHMSEETVDVLILRTHFSGRDDTRTDCTIQGSTYWKGSLTKYHPSLNYTLLYMSEHQETFEDARTAVSMSLAGRWYRSKSGGKNKAAYMVGAKCEPYESKEYLYELQHFTYTKENPAFGPKNTFLDERRWVMVSYSPDKNLALLFDSPATIYMKMCLSYTSQGRVPFGLALFDAEYDDWSKTNETAGSFPLTRAARKVIEDIKGATMRTNSSLKCTPHE
ncbi:uncharacterized protein LOC144129925 [Amblyomma americanum]